MGTGTLRASVLVFELEISCCSPTGKQILRMDTGHSHDYQIAMKRKELPSIRVSLRNIT